MTYFEKMTNTSKQFQFYVRPIFFLDCLAHPKKKKFEFLRRLCQTNKVQPADNESPEVRRQQLSNSYVEHHLTLNELSEVYPNSFIDVDSPDNSDGLDTNEAT